MHFRGERRSNETHQSSTDPEAKLARKGPGKEARLCYSGNALMENRHSLLVDFQVEPADGYAERRAAIAMADERLPGSYRITLGGDKGYDPRGFVASCRALKIPPHLHGGRRLQPHQNRATRPSSHMKSVRESALADPHLAKAANPHCSSALFSRPHSYETE